MRKSEYDQKHFMAFLDSRIKAHEEIINCVYYIQEALDKVIYNTETYPFEKIIQNQLYGASKKLEKQ